ncbi:MAG: CCA tRNA nucleotidyltransferase [Candidatus Aenigmarchaeota archaeon]|nr:CCA tRNA nucleotidyltransferase [Candidatus Aenigmarchaeota archaeon]
MNPTENVLSRIKPAKKEEENIRDFVSDLLRVAKTVSGLDSLVVGSIGKLTWLSGDHDIDIFLLFPKDFPRDDLEKKGLEFGENIVKQMKGKSKVKYAEHPYTHAIIKNYDVDIVPCYRIEKGDKIQSAVDRSPLHLQYVVDHLTPRMQDETRLLKQFCKGIGVYGSDAKHLGFSGYICELLILYYQSFSAVINAAGKWQAPQVIDILGYADKTKFPDQALIIVDPVDKNRNAAAVVSAENFVKFVSASKKFSEKPSTNFFKAQLSQALNAKQAKYLMNRGTKFLAIKMNAPDVIDDVLYPQLRKALKRIGNLIHHNEFSALRSYEFVSDKCYLIFELEIFSLPPVNNMIGPPLFSKQHTQEFLSKYRGKNFLYLSENRWVAEVKREYRTTEELIEKFIRQEKEKLILDGIPNHLAEVIRNAVIFDHKKFFLQVRKDKNLSNFLREKYFIDLGKSV